MPSSLDNLHAIILAGGSGTRLWPVSSQLTPKHLLSLQGSESLLQQTARRLLPLLSPQRILTVTHEDHQYEAKTQLSQVHPTLSERILGEPMAKNTLPAVSWSVAEIVRENPNALLAVFPADHSIRNEEAFHADLKKAFEVASQGYLVTLGIRPTGPETGYGYIQTGPSLDHSGAFNVISFKEKPDQPTALSYLKQGNYYWNSGMFVFSAKSFQKELQRLAPELHQTFKRVLESSDKKSALKAEYSQLKSLSIDYGIMEKAERVAVVPASFGWSDLGSWEAVYKERKKDTHQNVIEGNVLSLDTQSSVLITKKGLLATIGLKDMAVIQTDDAVLISPRNRVQEVKAIVERLKEQKSDLTQAHATVTRPWGQYTVLEEGLHYKIKRILVHPGQKLSLQRHQHRAEHWVVIEGTAKITNGQSDKTLEANQSTFIPQGEKHRLENPGSTLLQIIEVQTGTYLGEDDIERFDDVYGRK